LSVNRFPDAARAACACGARILALLRGAIDGCAQPSLAISGGSTPKLMFEYMAGQPFPWERVHIFWVDERAVPPSDPQSNFKLANETLIEPAGIPASNVHRILGELHPEEAARRYVLDIQEHFHLTPGELPQFDVIHRGIGPDVHTASLFPGEPLLGDREGIAAAVYVEKLKSWRITLLPGVLMAARNSVVLAAGADKAEPIDRIFHGPYDPIRYPAQVVTNEPGKVEWFLDAAAAARME
jgi:6-phosphogluconolactonase